jgi:hypothetical protein
VKRQTARSPIANVDAEIVRAYLAALDRGTADEVADAEEALRASLCHDCAPAVPCLAHVGAASERVMRRGHAALVAAELHETPGEIDMAGPDAPSPARQAT